MHMSNEYLNETQTWGEAINEWLVTEEPVVSVSEYYTVHYTVDSAGEATILAISDSQDTVLWENLKNLESAIKKQLELTPKMLITITI